MLHGSLCTGNRTTVFGCRNGHEMCTCHVAALKTIGAGCPECEVEARVATATTALQVERAGLETARLGHEAGRVAHEALATARQTEWNRACMQIQQATQNLNAREAALAAREAQVEEDRRILRDERDRLAEARRELEAGLQAERTRLAEERRAIHVDPARERPTGLLNSIARLVIGSDAPAGNTFECIVCLDWIDNNDAIHNGGCTHIICNTCFGLMHRSSLTGFYGSQGADARPPFTCPSCRSEFYNVTRHDGSIVHL